MTNSSNSQLAELLVGILIIMLCVLFVLVVVWIYLKIRSNRDLRPETQKKEKSAAEPRKTKIQEMYNMQSIFDFMGFDKIEDNMIIQKKGKRFLMVVNCKGINYDLMSGVEKTAVEQGFIQYLNTLRYPIQIYVQTRTVDLTGSLNNYTEKVKKIGESLAQKEYEYNQKARSGAVDKRTLDREKFEIAKAKNLYEYGLDIVSNTERMSLNKNILSKQYYIILSYYPEESNEGVYSEDEIRNIAFSELYTRAQSTISLLSVCDITGKILDSMELADLLYTAYNRDEAEVYDLKKALDAGLDNMYVSSPDVLDKRMQELDKQMEIEAIAKANDAIYKVKQEQEKEKQLRKKEEDYMAIVKRMAESIIEENEEMIGEEVAQRAKEKIEEEEEENVKEQKQTKKSRLTRKAE